MLFARPQYLLQRVQLLRRINPRCTKPDCHELLLREAEQHRSSSCSRPHISLDLNDKLLTVLLNCFSQRLWIDFPRHLHSTGHLHGTYTHWALGTGHWALGTGHWALGTARGYVVTLNLPLSQYGTAVELPVASTVIGNELHSLLANGSNAFTNQLSVSIGCTSTAQPTAPTQPPPTAPGVGSTAAIHLLASALAIELCA